MRVRAKSIEVSAVVRRGLAAKQGHGGRMATHGEIVAAIKTLIEIGVADWQRAGEQAIRDRELRQATLQFEEARQRLDAARDAADTTTD